MFELFTKAPSGIKGLDELTLGGLPAGRPTIICGGPGCGKTLLATTFLVSGALDHDEPGVFVSFDERARDLAINTASLGFDLAGLQKRGRLLIDQIHLDRQEIHETGEYDLEGLFVRLDYAVKKIGARRVVLDSIDTLFAGVPNAAIVRSELRRLFGWLKERNLTTIITAEQGEQGRLTRHGIEEYVSDCVISLDHRIIDELSTRRLRVIKYRGTAHGTNEYPFLIDEAGITILPVTSLGLAHTTSSERISFGIPGLDAMLDGKGVFKGTSLLVGGGPGTGKTSLAAHFADAACRRGEQCTYFSFEESPEQLMRNMRSIGIDLAPWINSGVLHCHAQRPSQQGLETHLAKMFKEVQEHNPSVVIVDPLSALLAIGAGSQTPLMVLRLVDFLKSREVTALYLSLQRVEDASAVGVSSIMDTWIMVSDSQAGNELVRNVRVVKSRGMAHSNRLHHIEFTREGLLISEFPLAPGGHVAPSAERGT